MSDITQILIDNKLSEEFCPTIRVIDSEALDFEMRKELASTLYTIFNGSMASSLELLGIDVNDEKQKRLKENEEGFDSEIFYPRASTYTTSVKDAKTVEDKGGRPADSNNQAKQSYDRVRNKTL